MNDFTKEEILEAHRILHKVLKPGDTVHCILRHVSSSGMSRRISLVVPRKNPHTGRPDIYCIDYLVAKLGLFKRQANKEGLVISGCGMDMGFHAVYSLGRALYPKGFKLAANQSGRNGEKSGYDNDGGYALKHLWL